MKTVPFRLLATNMSLDLTIENDDDLVRITIDGPRGIRLSGTVSPGDAVDLADTLRDIAFRLLAQNVSLDLTIENDDDLVRITIDGPRGIRLSGAVSPGDAVHLADTLRDIAEIAHRRVKGGG